MNVSPFLKESCVSLPCPRIVSVQTAALPLDVKMKMCLWGLVQRTLFRWPPFFCGGWRRSLLKLFGAKLAGSASIHGSARIDCPWNLAMGPFASIGEGAWLDTLDAVVLGEYVCIGQRAILLTGTHDFTNPSFPLVTKPIVIGYGSWIAVGAIILPGVKIGALCVVGAGSVVTRNLPEQMVCAGNPCRPIKRREIQTL